MINKALDLPFDDATFDGDGHVDIARAIESGFVYVREPHGGDAPLFLANKDVIALCGQCHDWQKHSTHPIGDKVKDPRNKNMTLQCLSCHRSHGTDYKHFIPFPTTSDLCVQCHEQFKR